MVRSPIAVRSPADIDNPIDQRQSPALVLLLRVESHDSIYAAVTGPRISRGNHHRAIRALEASGNVEGSQTLHIAGAVFFGPHHDIERARRRINDGRADDTHVAMKILVIAAARAGHVGV